MGFLLLLLALSAVKASSLPADKCSDVLEASQLHSTFAKSISHGMHSMTVEDLRFHFNPNASEANNIPTVNMDLQSSQPILNNAPSRVVSSSEASSLFQSHGLRVLDLVLSNMDNKMWDGKNLDILDRIVHSFHMQEMWHQTAVVYKQIVANPPKDKALCPCLKDVESNGIFHHLRDLALMIREPAIVFNDDKRIPRESRMMYTWNGGYTWHKYTEEELAIENSKSQEEGREGKMLTDSSVDTFLLAKPSNAVRVTDEASWDEAKPGMVIAGRMKTGLYDNALFVYCMLET